MLSDAQLERYSRQVVLPEVGGRGQARLLRARVAVAGSGSAASTAATLLGRAGVGALDLVRGPRSLPELSPDCRLARSGDLTDPADVIVHLSADRALAAALGRRAQAAGRPFVLGTLAGSWIAVATLVGRPCSACLPREETAAHRAGGPLGAPAALALGALAASEALRVLLGPAPHGRRTAFDLDAGTCEASELVPSGGCTLCGGSG